MGKRMKGFIEKNQKLIWYFLVVVTTSLIYMSGYRLFPDIVFFGNVTLVVGVVYYLYCMLFKQKYGNSASKILGIFIIYILGNELYSYKKLVRLIPMLSKYEMHIILAGIVLILVFLLLLLKLIAFLSSKEEVFEATEQTVVVGELGTSREAAHSTEMKERDSVINNNSQENSMRIEKRTGNSKKGIARLLVIASISIGVALVLIYVFYTQNIDVEKLNISNLFLFLTICAGCVLFISVAIEGLIILFYMFKFLSTAIREWTVARIKKQTEASWGEALIQSASVFIAILILALAYVNNTLTINDFVGRLLVVDYFAVPLAILVNVIIVLVISRIFSALLILLKNTDRIVGAIKEKDEEIQFSKRCYQLLETLVNIVLNTVTSLLELVEFVPDFFSSLKGMVLGNKDDNKKESKGDADKEKLSEEEIEKKDWQEEQEQRGIEIISIAAFCFAIVSWIATAHGMERYVFRDNPLQSYLISFGIQAILFVLNLQLPKYWGQIGEKKSGKKINLKKTVAVICYAIVLISSFFFSFVYITVSIYEKTYLDESNEALSNAYRAHSNEVEEYVDIASQLSVLDINALLTELGMQMPEQEGEAQTKEALEAEYIDLEKEYSDAKALTERRKSEKETAEAIYKEPMNVRWRNDETYKEERDAYEKALGDYQEAQLGESLALQKLQLMEKQIENYEMPSDELTQDLLAKILSDDFNKDEVEGLREELHERIMDLGDQEMTIEAFVELTSKSQELKIAIRKLTALKEVQEMENVALGVTESGISVESSEENIDEWKKNWKEQLLELKDIIQKLPEYSSETLERIKSNYSSIDVSFIERYDKDSKIEELDKLIRQNILDINEVEYSWNLLFKGEYPAMARFSAVFAIFLDMAALFAGLFIYFITESKKEKSDLEES